MNSKGSLSQSQPLCTDCKKAIGHVYCTGCDAYFCIKHYGDHRLVLDEQMKQIASTQKSVQERIDSAGLDATTTEELIEQISHWEKENAAKIQRTADQARSDILRLSDAYRAQVLREFEQFSNELNDLQETQNYVEPVLQARQTQVEQFQKEVYKLSPFATVVIDAEKCDQIDWNALVTVQSLVTTSETRQPASKRYPEDERAVSEHPEENDWPRQRSEATNRSYSGEENGRESMSVDTGLTDRISQKIINTIPVSNDRNAGTVCCHDNQLMYVVFDERSRSSQMIFLHNIAQPDEKLIIDWTPPTDSRRSSSNEDWIRDITYCDRLKSFLLLTETSVHTWNDDDDRFREFHRLPNRQLKRVTTDRNLLYLVAKSNQAATRYDTIITLNYDKAETTKSFADVVANSDRAAATAVDYDITDVAAAPYNHLMVTYRGESQANVGVHLFAIGSLGREWIPLRHFQLDDCWHKSIDYTPRVEWANQMTAFVLTEYNSGHLLMINEEGQIRGECQFQHQDGRSQSPINVSISAEGWVCTRYSSAIVVKKVE